MPSVRAVVSFLVGLLLMAAQASATWSIVVVNLATGEVAVGILGIATLGFYVDSAFADLRFDRALFLILITAALNMAIDVASRSIRARLRLKTRPEAV